MRARDRGKVRVRVSRRRGGHLALQGPLGGLRGEGADLEAVQLVVVVGLGFGFGFGFGLGFGLGLGLGLGLPQGSPGASWRARRRQERPARCRHRRGRAAAQRARRRWQSSPRGLGSRSGPSPRCRRWLRTGSRGQKASAALRSDSSRLPPPTPRCPRPQARSSSKRLKRCRRSCRSQERPPPSDSTRERPR